MAVTYRISGVKLPRTRRERYEAEKARAEENEEEDIEMDGTVWDRPAPPAAGPIYRPQIGGGKIPPGGAASSGSKPRACRNISYDAGRLQPLPMASSMNGSRLDTSSEVHPPAVPKSSKWQKKRFFDGDSELPLAANEDSWSNLAGSQAPSTNLVSDQNGTDGGVPPPHVQTSPSRTVSDQGGTVSEYDPDMYDDVFEEEMIRRGYRSARVPQYAGDYWECSSYHYRLTMAGLQPIPEMEESDSRPDDMATNWDLVFTTAGILSYFFDVGSDIFLAYEYYATGHPIWFMLTLLFILCPSIVMTAFSLHLYIRDWKVGQLKLTRIRWASRFIFLILQLGPVLRAVDTLVFACRSRNPNLEEKKRKWYYREMVDEATDSALIRLFETFLEAAPQLVLQLYVMSQLGTKEGLFLVFLQVLGLVTSIISIALSLVIFQRALRASHKDEKAQMTIMGSIVYFIWRLFTIAARVLAVAMFASIYTYWVFVFVAVHFALMFCWFLQQHTRYCTFGGNHSKGQEFCFRVMTAFVHIFCFFNVLEGYTRLRCFAFYMLVYIENAVMILIWYFNVSTRSDIWYQTPVLVAVLAGFFIGVLFQLGYYMMFHPNNKSKIKAFRDRKIRFWVPCNQLSLYREVEVEVEVDNQMEEQQELEVSQPLSHSTPMPKQIHTDV